VADVDLAASPPLIEDALFHCQQAAEKASKGFLTAHDRIFRKTHDLDALGCLCEAVDPTLTSALGSARDLTVFFIDPLPNLRYSFWRSWPRRSRSFGLLKRSSKKEDLLRMWSDRPLNSLRRSWKATADVWLRTAG